MGSPVRRLWLGAGIGMNFTVMARILSFWCYCPHSSASFSQASTSTNVGMSTTFP